MKRRPILAIAGVIACGVAVLTWKVWPREAAPPPPQPPAIDPAGVDPVVWREIEANRTEVERTPKSPRGWGRLGMVLLAHQFRSESLTCLARAEFLEPDDVRWPYYQALAVRRSDPEATIAHLRRAVATGGGGDGPRLLLAELLLQRGQTDEAAALFQAAQARDSSNSRAALGMAQAAFGRDDLSACMQYLEKAKDDPRTRKAAHTFLAEIQQRRGDRPAAEEAWRVAQALPDDVPWPDPLAESIQEMMVGHLEIVTHAASLLQQNRPDQAIPLLQRAIEDYPESNWARVLLGRAWLRVGNLATAEAVLREAVRRAPETVEAQFYLGVVLSEQKQFAAAIPFFRQAVQLKPDYALAWYNLGFCNKQIGKRGEARTAFQSAVDCRSQFAEARANLGELMAEDGETDAALDQLRQAILLTPKDAHAQELLEKIKKQSRHLSPR
ncbi:tetratricopeptide repeat protein [Fimbriiglobus ruber]|uniref:Tetratricopeptide repeat protein n=1 Tax=Fimbriiglobus ruber TaxID=1908690 RepID=A0A225DZU9_9BACT|nr:tetratricopeptide repeat protein [Fimbriiglobus ruber]OWK46861.1 hypothetical protein FRUB_00560 [Fimbriiglobus ruber]